MFYVIDITTELYTWRLKKPDGEARWRSHVRCIFLEEVVDFPEAIEATVISMNLRPLKQEQVVS